MRGISPRLAHRALALTRTLWFTPLILAVVAIGVGIVLPAVDRLAPVRQLLSRGWATALLASTPDGARAILATAAGALATILGVAFSLTLVTLQLAAQQYTPRLIGRMMDDFITKLVLGSYIGTTAYLLVVLRSVHAAQGARDGFVPWLSIVVGLVLFIYCLALLATFLHHLGRSTQAASVVSSVAHDAIARIRKGALRSPEGAEPASPTGEPAALKAPEHGYVQMIDLDRIARVAPHGTTFVHIEVSAGDFVFPGQDLAVIWPARPLDADELAELHAAFGLGSDRTPEQDLLLAVQQISDVALKALSPSLNDETTAVLAVNELGAIGAELAKAGAPRSGHRRVDANGVVVVAPLLGMERFLREAFSEVVRNAAGHPRVLSRVAEVLAAVAALATRDDSRAAVAEAGEWVSEAMEGLGASGRLRVERRVLEVREQAARGPPLQ